MNLKPFKHNDWVQIWEGTWSFLSCSHFGDQYTKEKKYDGRPFMDRVVIFYKEGGSNAWVRQHDRDILGKYLAGLAEKDDKEAGRVCAELKRQVDIVMAFMQAQHGSKFNIDVYEEFWDKISTYYKPHINIKYIVDYLDEKRLKKLLPKLQEARKYAEPVFDQSEKLMILYAKDLSKQFKLPYKLVLCLRKEELFDHFRKKTKLPSKLALEKRYKKSAFLFDPVESELLVGSDGYIIEKIIFADKTSDILKGVPAYPGKVTGVVKVVNDPSKGDKLKKGEVLVSGSTRPEFLPIMHRASAFVTDSGGILSHAAITAREMKKPCIVGTKIGTKVLKDGDLVEVDANKGIVRKI